VHEYLEVQHPDIVFLASRGLPHFSAKDAIAAVRRSNSEIPIIIVGRWRDARLARILLQAGASDFFDQDKPSSLPGLLEVAMLQLGKRADLTIGIEPFVRVSDSLRESQRLATIGRLAGSIVHEINNPLEAITNLVFLAQGEPGLPPAAKAYLASAQRELSRVGEISKQTLSFCRETPALVSLRLGDLLDQVLVLCSQRIADKKLTVVRNYVDQKAMLVLPGEIRQVFLNLIVNAIEATSQRGTLCLRVRSGRLAKDPRVIGQRVTIGDNGVGMTEQVRHRIGEAFFTTKGQQGTGLGLWVSQSIVQRHRGRIAIRSSTGPNHGTVISLFLPSNLKPHVVPRGSNPKTAQRGTVTARNSSFRQDRPRAKGA
jgi:signal transduction histidine kinase